MLFLRKAFEPNSKKQQQFRVGTDNSLWGYQPQPNAARAMHLIDLIEKELQIFRETGRAIHLAHAARALDEALEDERHSEDNGGQFQNELSILRTRPSAERQRQRSVIGTVRHMECTQMLKKLAYMVPLVIALSVTCGALAQTSPPKTDDKAPVAGANSFTEGQAKSRIEGAGFTQVTGLKKDDQGVWRGSAMKDGKQATVSVDFRGNVVSP